MAIRITVTGTYEPRLEDYGVGNDEAAAAMDRRQYATNNASVFDLVEWIEDGTLRVSIEAE